MLFQICHLVVEQFDKLTVTPVETISDFQPNTHFDKLSVQIKLTFEKAPFFYEKKVYSSMGTNLKNKPGDSVKT